MSLTYRDGSEADAHGIADLFKRSFTATFGHLYDAGDLREFLHSKRPAQFRAELADPSFQFRLVEADDELAGYIKLGPPDLPVDTPPDTIQLHQLYIDDRWHGRGAAQTLMDWALGFAAAQGARQMQLSVYVDNHRARRFYERYGFEPIGRYEFMVGKHADEDIVLRHVIMDRAA